MDDRVPEHRDSHTSSSHEPSLEPTPTRREDLGKHSVYTHFPKDRNCEICRRTKITRAPCRRRNGGAVPRAENFGDLMTADHKVLSEESESRNNHRYAVVVQDSTTQWNQTYPCQTKTSQETERRLRKFLEPSEKPKVINTDNSLEFGESCEHLPWNHRTSTHHRFETSDIVERAVRRIMEGTSAVLLQSGLDEKWWAVYGMLLLSAKMFKTSWQTGKHQMKGDSENHLKAELFRLEQRLNIIRFLQKAKSRLHQYCKKVLLGLFLGHVLFAGGT